MKDTQATATEKDNPTSFNKAVWRLEPTSAWGVDINNTSEFPSFVLEAVKVYLLRRILFYFFFSHFLSLNTVFSY